MCGGGGGDGGAGAARKAEEERQRLIREGQTHIDETFGGTFTPEFYDQSKQSYLDYYLPQLDEQFSDAKRGTVLSLANNNMGASTAAGRAFADVQQTYQRALDKIRNDAVAYSQGLKGDVSGAKENLYALSQSGTDPASVADLALTRSQSLSAPGSFDPLSDFFTSVAVQNANRRNAADQGFTSRSPDLLFNNNGNRAVRVVGR